MTDLFFKEKDMIVQQINDIKNKIKEAAVKSGRNPEEIKLLLATKTVAPENIITAIQSGASLIGENRVQELQEKYDALKEFPHTTHFIGHLQTNKIKTVLKYADLIETIDRTDLVEKLDKRLQFEGRSIPVFVQVNTSYEESKFGVAPEKTLEFIKQISRFDTLKVKGLMTIGIFHADTERVRNCYRVLTDLKKQITELGLANIEMNELSMGMSGDFEIAIEEGATIVRVGTAIFGQRQYPDSYYWNESKG